MAIDERGGYEPEQPKRGVRTAVLGSWEAGQFWGAHTRRGNVKRMTDLGWVLRYAKVFGMSTKKRTPMDIPKMVAGWVEAVVGMSTAHDKDQFDAHDARADELMGPLLAAPVKQIREFYEALRQAMRSDERVPMVVWMGFEAWGEVVVKDAPDEGIKRLKNKLAGEIADLVEGDIRDQIPEAVKRALRWRDPETLEAVKERLESGEKPKLRGRQSCLFLELGRGKRKVSVML